MKVFEVLQENFIRNLVGDVRNAFKPGIAVTPNMIAELEDGLARLKRGEQPTPRQQKMMDTFMSTTMAREIKKTFGVDIEEDNMPNAADRPRDSRVIRNMPNAADQPRDSRVIRNMPNAADVNPMVAYVNALKDPNADPEWVETLRKIAAAFAGMDPDDATNEGMLDWFKSVDNPVDQQDDVVPMVKQLLDQGMSPQQVIQQVERELGVRPRYIQQAIDMVGAGLAETNEFNNMTVGEVESKIRELARELGLEGRYLNAWTQLANDLFAKIASRQYAATNVEEGRLKSKSYRKSYKAAKASGRRRKKSLRDDIAETATSGATSVGGGNIASVSNPSVTRNAKKPKKRKGVAPNALDSGANLMSGQVLKR